MCPNAFRAGVAAVSRLVWVWHKALSVVHVSWGLWGLVLLERGFLVMAAL